MALPSLKIKLISLGYDSITNLKSEDIIQLTQDGLLTEEEVMCLLQAVHGVPPSTQTAAARILSDTSRRGISFGSYKLNSLFDQTKGLPLCKVTEACGESGSGKTQLSMQLAVNVQLPLHEGGLEGECIYIDTEGSFIPSRIKAMVSEKKVFQDEGTKEALKRIHVFRVLDHIELVALVVQLPTILEHYTKVKLIIVDSIAFHFRLNVRDSKTRSNLLEYIGNSLAQLANRLELAVFLTNHVTTGDGSSGLIPALGKGLSRWCSHRFFVFRKHQFWYALMFKSPNQTKEQTERFYISYSGITDLKDETENDINLSENYGEATSNYFKSATDSAENYTMHNYTEGENIFEVDCLNTIGPPDNELDYASDDSQSREKDFSEDSSVQNESDSKILLSGVLSTRNIPDSFSTEDEDEDEYTQQIIHDSEESMSDSYSPIEYMDDPVGDQPSFKKRYIEDQNTRPKRRRVIPNSQEDESEYSVMLSVTNAMNDTSLYEGMQDILGVRERRHRKVIPNSQPDIEPGDTEDQGLYESRIRGAFLKKFIDDDQSI